MQQWFNRREKLGNPMEVARGQGPGAGGWHPPSWNITAEGV